MMSTQERRRFPRVAAAIEVRYEYGGESFTDQTINLSLGGLYINAIRDMDLGTPIIVNFSLPGFDHSFRISGKVKRINAEETSEGPPGMGIEFVDVSKEDERMMMQFVVQSQLTQKGF